MARILVVDDSRTQLDLVKLLLESEGHTILEADDGDVAIECIDQDPPDVVITDLRMQRVDGLQVVTHTRRTHPNVPVILMTQHGSEDVAAEALRRGAASYIPKNVLKEQLSRIVSDLLEICEARARRQETLAALKSLRKAELQFEIENDPVQASHLVAYLEEQLHQTQFCDQAGIFRIVLALKEALTNAIDHGNLELDSKLREDTDGEYHRLAESRRSQPPYCDRRVRVTVRMESDRVAYTIEDEGPGFDPSTIPDPTDPENLIRASGRGLMLIQTFMDDVEHNDRGNIVTLVKHRETKEEPELVSV